MDRENSEDEYLIENIRKELSSFGIFRIPEDYIINAMKEKQKEIAFLGIYFGQQYGIPQQMFYTLHLRKHNEPNDYHAHAISAEILGHPDRYHKFYLRRTPLRVDQVQSLLNGRSLRKTLISKDGGKINNRWYRLDSSEEDRNGKHTFIVTPDKQISLTKSTEVEKDGREESLLYDAIGKFPLKENLFPEQRLRVILEMLRGEAVHVQVLKNGKISQGYIQFGNQPGKMELMMFENGKLIKYGPDLKELQDQRLLEPPPKKHKRKSI